MSELKELSNLPEEIRMWGEQALTKIVAPEKRHEAANDLRYKIDNLWNECSSESPEERVAYVLKKLGDVDVAAEEMKTAYEWKATPKVDIKAGIVFLILSAFCGIYAFMAFFVFPSEASGTASPYATYLTGKGAGSGAVVSIVLLALSVMILLNARKEE